jgi:hypothetical protein
VRRLFRMAVVLGALLASACALFGRGRSERAWSYPPHPSSATSCSFARAINVGSSVTIVVTCKVDPGSTIKIK